MERTKKRHAGESACKDFCLRLYSLSLTIRLYLLIRKSLNAMACKCVNRQWRSLLFPLAAGGPANPRVRPSPDINDLHCWNEKVEGGNRDEVPIAFTLTHSRFLLQPRQPFSILSPSITVIHQKVARASQPSRVDPSDVPATGCHRVKSACPYFLLADRKVEALARLY